MYAYNLVHTRTMEEVIQFKEATENSLDVLNDPQSSWKYVENNMYILYEYTVKSTLLKSILSVLTRTAVQ